VIKEEVVDGESRYLPSLKPLSCTCLV
jgi:hypothetical protein